ncbi:hypothetical protein [Sphingomonas sp. S2-65]|uniref:hypothetical protein n=1 Tax=Sphingomonas sp. S2-65 TaxID=2903960 RepID=UPI001F24D8AB|nr:hypothetical protein [Sphingomonas sp. S2-65]UYY58602.1 hypothetical protein LZ586_00325 [Sphingomonas sp. S2-65]
MKTSPSKRSRAAALAAVLLAGVAVPAQGQQDRPESLLPPGFDEPAPTPAPTPSSAPAAPGAPRPAEIVQPLPAEPATSGDSPIANVAAADAVDAAEIDWSKYELPEFARHSLAKVGATAAGNEAFPADAFGQASGKYLQTLMRRLDAPVASRWASILLRRALMSPVDTPADINGADFAAERAWVLLRMGEAVAARSVVEDVDTDNYTAPLYEIAMQAAMANGDPAALCPVVDKGAAAIPQRGWALARAMCAGLAGKPTEAGQLLRQARWRTSQGDIDTLLAEKVLGTGAQGRRAVTIEWAGVPQLTAWRWGLATATRVEVPAWLYRSAGPNVRYWQALAPNIDAAQRAPAAELAATAGVFSNAGLVDLYSEIEQGADAAPEVAGVARNLRVAYTDTSASARVKALRALWDDAETPRTRYARLILTARAAAWVPADAKLGEADRLVASMLSAGLDGAAMEWRTAVTPGSEGWALLTLADPAGAGAVSSGDVEGFGNTASRRKGQMLLAGLAGLGRMSPADAQSAAAELDVAIGGSNAWTRAIDEAGQRGDTGMVVLLAAVGMQSPNWDWVTPEALFHVVASLRAAGMVNYARMIAVEAVSRA